MSRNSAYSRTEFKIVLINLICIFRSGNGSNRSLAEDKSAQFFTQFRTVRQILGNYIHCALNCIFDCCNFLFLIYESLSLFFGYGIRRLFKNYFSKRFKTFFARNRTARFPFRLERTINVLNLDKRHRFINSGGNFISHFFLFGY